MVQFGDKFLVQFQTNEDGNGTDTALVDVPKCVFLGIKADFYIGLMGNGPDAVVGNVDAICAAVVEKAIINLLGKGMGDITWPVILDLNKNLLYHTYEAHENGMSATQGWLAYCLQNDGVSLNSEHD